MSNLGNIEKSYGKSFNVAVANTYSNIVLSGKNLPSNSFIISSNVDDNGFDTGSYSLLVTDSDGSPIRLTYCIKEGNGFVHDSENSDVLYLNIDEKYIVDSDSGLSVNIGEFANDNIILVDGKLSLNVNKLRSSSENESGVTKIDGNTVKTDEDTLYVDTNQLTRANNSTNTYGVVESTDGILKINNGVVSLDQTKLPLSNENDMGISTGDDNTLIVNNDSSLSVNTQNLEYCDSENFGIVKVDGNKISSVDGTLKVNTSNLKLADYTTKGILKIDSDTIITDGNGKISVKDDSKIGTELDSLNQSLSYVLNELSNLKDGILSQING